MFSTFNWRLLCFFVAASSIGCQDGFGDANPADTRAPESADAGPGPQAPNPDAGPGPQAPNPDAAPIGEPLPDAGPPPPNCTDQTINLLSNPNFDSGPTPEWLENNGGIELIVGDLPVAPQTPTYAAWLGGLEVPVTHAIAQRHTIPADATSLVVRGYRWIASADTAPNNDVLRFFILDGNDQVLEFLTDPAVACPSCTYSNTAGASGAFVPFTLTASTPYAGQPINFHIQSDNVGDNSNTNFFLDTMALEITACR